MLKITQEQQKQMYRHAQNTYPEECCGILFGTFQPQGTTIVTEVWETENAWEAESQRFEAVCPEASDDGLSKHNRFTIEPAVLLKAQKYARINNLKIVGIYHSHPDQTTIPSEFDRAIAWDTYSYLIMSVQEGQVVDCRSWILDEQQQFQAEQIVTESCH
ncbi:Mov34/MPN/PAD-1 family protein [Halothece sp. PCC 7418]|uniref:Mov34/MPN/PAD-1 family protein n=1 Tax=Halothece sp. (strain PCC 7418) TaxID=65093 RepID=UPI0002A07BCE|nr:M67 family metallopeptidase [Halothece sp. PCC 7418]AFZ44777.1 Mov34/MPN/PAD-1 family protein [Halothece sp. PCC 7418]